MFITKKHIPRRAFLRGAGVTLALPLLDSMIPAQTPLAKTGRGIPRPGSPASSFRTGWLRDIGFPKAVARASQSAQRREQFKYPMIMQPLGAVPRPDRDHERVVVQIGRAASRPNRRGPLGGRGVSVRRQAAKDHRRGRLRRHHHRSDHRAKDRPGERCCPRSSLPWKIRAPIPATAAKAIAALIRTPFPGLRPLSRSRWSWIRRWPSSACSAPAAAIRRSARLGGSSGAAFWIRSLKSLPRFQEGSRSRRPRPHGRVGDRHPRNRAAAGPRQEVDRPGRRYRALWLPRACRNPSTST